LGTSLLPLLCPPLLCAGLGPLLMSRSTRLVTRPAIPGRLHIHPARSPSHCFLHSEPGSVPVQSFERVKTPLHPRTCSLLELASVVHRHHRGVSVAVSEGCFERAETNGVPGSNRCIVNAELLPRCGINGLFDDMK